ncbi:MAG: phosphopantetheine adenylyltransferase [Pseudomonadota bacterium]
MSMIAIGFYFLALIHLLPALAAMSPRQLTTLYGVAPDDKVLTTLLQHRAVLLGLVGAAFIAGAFLPGLRWAALIGGSISMVGFLLIALINGELSGPLKKISIVDAAGLPVAVILFFLLSKGP